MVLESRWLILVVVMLCGGGSNGDWIMVIESKVQSKFLKSGDSYL